MDGWMKLLFGLKVLRYV